MDTKTHNEGCIGRAAMAELVDLRATYDPSLKAFRVPSRTNPERPPYRVHVLAVGDQVSVACNCEAGRSQPPLGDTACWHGAAACLVAQRLGLVAYDGKRWVLGEKGAELAAKAAYVPVVPVCAVCGESVDDLVLVPVERQAVMREGQTVHRGCRG